MEMYENIINFLFNKKEDENLFGLEDNQLKNIDRDVTKADNAITKFIENRVHPKSRKKLRKLLNEYSNSLLDYLHRENELFYENGVSDGIKIMIKALSTK